jgi:hypothetical protein
MVWSKLGRGVRVALSLAWPGVLAGAVAVGITYQMSIDRSVEVHAVECRQRPCFMVLAARIEKLEDDLAAIREQLEKEKRK